MRIRPCIDLRQGKVVQIVGSQGVERPQTNFETDRSAVYYAELYRRHQLSGGHVICLGPGNETAALSALHAYPQGMQLGGGVNLENAQSYLDAGASHVILTSALFDGERLSLDYLRELVRLIGRERIVIDLSCRCIGQTYHVMTNHWQTQTELTVDPATLDRLTPYCDEFLIHAVDVEGKRAGVDETLLGILASWELTRPLTYAGGVRSLEDVYRVKSIGRGQIDLTIGSALDLFGGEIAFEKIIELDLG